MSFDLDVWHESAPITADAASDKLFRSDDGEPAVFDGHPGVMAFYTALIERFPALDLEASQLPDPGPDVWSVPPEPSDTLITLCLSFSHCGEVAPIVRQLAADHGLVCFDPQLHVVRPNVPGYQAALTLSCGYGVIPDPSGAHIERAVRRLNDDDWNLLLERADGWFAQAGYGETAGVDDGCYAMEYQEGSIERQYHSETSDISDVQRFLLEFLEGKDTWKRRHSWVKLDL